MLSQGIPHASSATRESLRMPHTLCLHALPLMRRGWSCTQRSRPLYIPKSRTLEPTHKTFWRWWLARVGLMTSMSKNSAFTSSASSRQPERPFFSQIYSKTGPINPRTTLPRWRQERRRRRSNMWKTIFRALPEFHVLCSQGCLVVDLLCCFEECMHFIIKMSWGSLVNCKFIAWACASITSCVSMPTKACCYSH